MGARSQWASPLQPPRLSDGHFFSVEGQQITAQIGSLVQPKCLLPGLEWPQVFAVWVGAAAAPVTTAGMARVPVAEVAVAAVLIAGVGVEAEPVALP